MSLYLSTLDAPRPKLQIEPLIDPPEMAHPTYYIFHAAPHDRSHHVSLLLLTPHLILLECLLPGPLHM